jgi:hypothetical protein
MTDTTIRPTDVSPTGSRFQPNFETWDLRRGERTSCSRTEAEARGGCRNDMGRLLTIYAGDGLLVASYRDGKELTNTGALESWSA